MNSKNVNIVYSESEPSVEDVWCHKVNGEVVYQVWGSTGWTTVATNNLDARFETLDNKIDNIPAQVQADWNQWNSSKMDFIKNKPAILSNLKNGSTDGSVRHKNSEEGGVNSISFSVNGQAGGIAAMSQGLQCYAYGAYSFAGGAYSMSVGGESFAFGNTIITRGSNQVAFGKYNKPDSLDTWDEWVAGTSYVVGDRVKKTSGSTVSNYICNTDNSDEAWDSQHWTNLYGKLDYIEMVGNGTSSSNKSNARTLDWEGNEVLAGKLTIGGDSGATLRANNGSLQVSFDGTNWLTISAS